MKPIKLELEGFITYKNKITIDFTKLYDSHIFLISGDTGAGKTSIFDAIVYALYGEIARKNVNDENLRSDFLTKNDSYTYVDFEFIIRNEIYRIKRIPKQRAVETKRPKNISHSVYLWKIVDGEEILISEKVNEVKDKIKEIIGLDNNQFKKVALLAQGEFSEFLSANSNEKRQILGEIFKTSIYKDLEISLKEKAKEKKQDGDNLKNSLLLEINKREDLKTRLEDESIDLFEFDKIIDNSNSMICEIDQSIEIIENDRLEKYNLLEKEQESREYSINLNNNIRKFKDIEKELLHLDEKKKEYENLSKKITLSKKAYEISFLEKSYIELDNKIKNYKNNLSDNKIKLNEIDEKLKEYSNSDEIIKELEEKLERSNRDLYLKNDLLEKILKLKNIEKDFYTIDNEYKDLNEKISSKDYIENNIKNIEQIIESYQKEKIIINEKKLSNIKFDIKLQDENRNIKEKLTKLSEKNALSKKLENNEKELSKINVLIVENENLEKIALNNRRNTIINNFIDEINNTGICPVCKTKHENNLDKLEIDIDNNKDYDKIEKNLNDLKIQSGIIQKEITDIKLKLLEYSDINTEDIDFLKKQFSLEKEKLDKENLDIKEKSEEIEKSIEENKRKLDDFKAKKSDIDIYISKIDEIKESYFIKKNIIEENKEILSENSDDLKKDINAINRNITNRKLCIEKMRDTLKKLNDDKIRIISLNENLNEFIQNSLDELIEKRNKFYDNLNDSFESNDDYRNSLSFYESLSYNENRLKEYTDRLSNLNFMYNEFLSYKDRDLIDIEIIEKNIQSIKDEISNLDKNYHTQSINKKELENIRDNIIDFKKKYENNFKEFEIISNLSKIANGEIGNVSGREKLNFETFTLIYYFNRILEFANKRLKKISNGQYEMIRNSSSGGGKKSGLDIDIFDSNTGKTRPSSTLSGGETFLASLSLALGLSDEISHESGGIQIDTLFIDEGFGTLSKDYLDNAINVIESLSYNDRLIGIISHVQDIKDAFPSKILVNYTKENGSNIEVVV